MPKVVDNSVIAALRGQLGKDIVIRQTKWGTIVQRAPTRRSKGSSPAQTANENRFGDAAKYGSKAYKLPEYVAAAATPGCKDSALNLATRDYLRPPVVEQINLARYWGKAGDFIEVVATDDFMVKAVKVKVTNAEGTFIEQGLAEQVSSQKSLWTYTTTQAVGAGCVKVKAQAWDLPGHEAVLEVEKDLG